MQLSLYVNNLAVNVSRSIDIGEIYGTIKDETAETIFQHLPSEMGDGATTSKTPHSIRHGDREAEERYNELRHQIWKTDPINESRKNVQDTEGTETKGLTEGQLRAATCARLEGSPAVPHAPPDSVRVTTLQNLIPRRLAHFLARLPFLLRLVLMLLSYLHPIKIPSITIAGPGHWLAEILQHRVLDQYLEESDESHDLQYRAKEWLENAMLSVDFTKISALGQVPVRTMHDVTAGLRCADTTVFRSAPDVVETAMELGGADLEFVLPSYLLPHHEHLVPQQPNRVHEANLTQQHEQKDEDSREGQTDLDEDCAHIYMRAHANLPAATDHSLLEFIVDLANVSEIFQMQQDDEADLDRTAESSQHDQNGESHDDNKEEADGKSGLRERTKRAFRGHVKDRAKQLAMRGLNKEQSQWIKTMVRNTASQLEKMHGDVGYSGSITVPLEPYRGSHDMASKLLP